MENGEDAVGETAANRGTKRTYITSIIITVTLGGVKTALTNLIADGEAMFVCTIPGREPFVIILAKSLFDILMEKSTSTWFDEYNDDQQKRAFVFYAHEITECFLCNMVAAAEGFNTVSCLLLGSADNLEEKDYEKATMNIAEDILEIKKMIRKNTACVVGVKFKTLASASSEKKKRFDPAPPLTILVSATTPVPDRSNGRNSRERKPANPWNPPAWNEQAEGYKLTRLNLPSFNKEESTKKRRFLTKHSFTRKV